MRSLRPYLFITRDERVYNTLGNYPLKARKDLTYPTCAVCSRLEKFAFYVPDDIWVAIVPTEFQGSIVCLACFDDFAKDKDIDYSNTLQDFVFAGTKATFIFEVAWAGDH